MLRLCIVDLRCTAVSRYSFALSKNGGKNSRTTDEEIPGFSRQVWTLSTPAYGIVFTWYTVKRCYRIVSSPGLICLMVNSLMRWWLCSLRVQCSETQSDWNNRSYNNIHPKLVQIHIISLHYYRTHFRQS